MFRIILFLVLIALAAFGAAWVADQTGDVVLTWSGWRIEVSLPVFVLVLGAAVVAAMLAWWIVRALWRTPDRIRRGNRARRQTRGRHAITHGLIAIGTGDAIAARRHAHIARRDAQQEPLALLLHAQAAQLDGDRTGAQRAFRAMAEREETRLLGLRGLFVEAQRADDPVAAVAIAEEALKTAPASPWASHAILGFRCAQSDWNGALKILDANFAAGQIDKAAHRRERGVLLTARALELETQNRDQSRESVMEAVKLAPTLVPAAVLAGKFLSEAHQIRRAMRVLETAWLAQPHPDLADAYAHVRLGDSARQRLVRVETLAAKTPGHIEGALALARAAIDATEFSRAREALAPFIAAPTQRVAMLMAEIERTEHGDSGRARSWTLRAVRAAHDPVWTADGYVSDRWRPVSPVSGRLDAFQWQTPLAALPSDKPVEVEPEPAMRDLPPPSLSPAPAPQETAKVVAKEVAKDPTPVAPIAVPHEATDVPVVADAAIGVTVPAETASEPVPVQDNSPLPEPPLEEVPPPPPPAPLPSPPVFRSRRDIDKTPAVAPIIPIIRPPDDPGIDDPLAEEDTSDSPYPPQAQRGGWRGFLARWGA
ncbi:heme biosynthesis protein HemY [Bradyrhizobium prioriisuperbiae]|uniref:heme biosynthesis protein HemY n=1 Tax=Bradyrhizobium prioriisuperbiae TaxID=2854389 RepID=UPI0028E8CD60|nr:heme biosynthesis HemY N-terminal domain-containing protein [Bradyrhizobium prioritasuperba]